jgi:L-amino acid N-acyltransferase YncA
VRPLTARTARRDDCAAIADIYNQGIAERVATFETRPREPGEVVTWLAHGLPFVVVEDADGRVIGFAGAFPYHPERPPYAGIAEFSAYVDRSSRGQGAGSLAMSALVERAEAHGLWKLVSRIFVENEPSRRLLGRMGFDEVGIYRRHARLDGEWRDVVIVERLLGEALRD